MKYAKESVTSLAEVWIEMSMEGGEVGYTNVTSLAEVWIEIRDVCVKSIFCMSLPLRKCGLKSSEERKPENTIRHFPCGSVD